MNTYFILFPLYPDEFPFMDPRSLLTAAAIEDHTQGNPHGTDHHNGHRHRPVKVKKVKVRYTNYTDHHNGHRERPVKVRKGKGKTQKLHRPPQWSPPSSCKGKKDKI